MPAFVGYRNGPDCSTAKSATITSSVLRWINPPTAHPNILPSAKMPMLENIRRSLTGPNTANSSRMKSGSTATSFFLPRASAPPTRGPRAKVWLGVEHKLGRKLVDLAGPSRCQQEQHCLRADQMAHALAFDHPSSVRLDALGILHLVGHAGAAADLDPDAHAGDRTLGPRQDIGIS